MLIYLKSFLRGRKLGPVLLAVFIATTVLFGIQLISKNNQLQSASAYLLEGSAESRIREIDTSIKELRSEKKELCKALGVNIDRDLVDTCGLPG